MKATKNPIANALQEVVKRHWKSLPPQAKSFLLDSPTSIEIHGLSQFWSSSPTVADYTSGLKVHDAVGASWFIALCYLKGGRLDAARALLLNGSFLRQCMSIPIDSILSLCRGISKNAPMTDYLNLPFYNHGFHSLLTQKMMEGYLHSQLSAGYQPMLQSFVKIQSDHVIDYFGNLEQDWGTGSTKKNRRQKTLPLNDSEQTQIQLFLSDGRSENAERHGVNIGSSTTLKVLFNNYAEKRGVSLRSLRFSFNGKTLFLSATGNRTPNDLNMKDQDVITVYGTSTPQGADSTSSQQRCNAKTLTKNTKAKKGSSHKAKRKGKKKRPVKREEPAKTTLEEYKTQHSIMMSKLHEELQPRLKGIRTKLNTLGLERQPPKQRRRSNKKKKKEALTGIDLNQMLPNLCGGKAGKPYFNVHIGELNNLYKTTKLSQKPKQSSRAVTLDLHGCTKEEALQRLDENLMVWEDTAMQGLYPFVIPARIICGCGNQILSETVEHWIGKNVQVANAPKNWLC